MEDYSLHFHHSEEFLSWAKENFLKYLLKKKNHAAA